MGQVFRETVSIIPTKNASAITNESSVSTRTGQQSTISSSGAKFITTLETDSLVEAKEYSLTACVSPRGDAYGSVCVLSEGADTPTNVASARQCLGCGR
jgi:hypothetical protein